MLTTVKRWTGIGTTKTEDEPEDLRRMEYLRDEIIEEFEDRVEQGETQIDVTSLDTLNHAMTHATTALYRQGKQEGRVEEQERSEDEDDLKTLIMATLGVAATNLIINAWPIIQSITKAASGSGG